MFRPGRLHAADRVNAFHAGQSTARHGVGSNAEPVALVIEWTMPVV